MAEYHMFKLLLTNVKDLQGLPPILGISKIACALICLRKDGCSSFFHHADEMSCVPSLTRHFNTDDLSIGTGYKYYMIRPDCKEGWEVFRGQCYFLQTTYTYQDSARASCVGLGAYLAQTNSAVEDAFFRSLAEGGSFWIGGKLWVGQQWKWQDGSNVVPRWADGQPDWDGTCMEQWGWGWNDAFCGAGLKSLCEK